MWARPKYTAWSSRGACFRDGFSIEMHDPAFNIETRPLHSSIGAAIYGVDLSRPLNPSTVAAINNAWMKHIVLVFPSQPISDDALVAFGQQFG